jgi:tRNA (cytidine/uridine-2'-O-)-methyltransferase
MRLALFQPDIPQNLGAAVRLTACLGVGLDIIEPCGFPLSDASVRRTAMDYAEKAQILRHASWSAFQEDRARTMARLLLFTTAGAQPFHSFTFRPDDILMMGRESAGAPLDVHQAADARIFIPLALGARSLNIVTAAAIGLAEALRQTDGFHKAAP